jgi:hypothetical protein
MQISRVAAAAIVCVLFGWPEISGAAGYDDIPCTRSKLRIIDGESCRHRVETTNGGTGSNDYDYYNVVGSAGGYRYDATLGMPQAPEGYMRVLSTDQILDRLKRLDDTTGKASNWSEPIDLDTDVLVKFSAGGADCLGFYRLGGPHPNGFKTAVYGYFCSVGQASAPELADPQRLLSTLKISE